MKKILTILAMAVLFIGCSSDNTGADLSINDSNFIVMGAVNSSGQSQVEMPMDVFGGSSDDLSDFTFDIAINGSTEDSNVNPLDYYIPEIDIVAFYISSVAANDTVTFTITFTSSGVSTVYSGTFSASDNSAAILESSADDSEDDTGSDSSDADTSDEDIFSIDA